MTSIVQNVFICLVHENQDCIIDLVRNLKYLDPRSKIVLYNGGTDQQLFDHFPFERYDIHIHPEPKPKKWGWLHDFALDCMRYALNQFEFDTITIIDSDQLGIGSGYSAFITEFLNDHENAGMLGTTSKRQYHNTQIDPAITAYQEETLWMPLLKKLPYGEDSFLYWTFWPSTVFTNKACKDLVELFATNKMLHQILETTKIWASEEVILPTLVKALGYEVLKNPCNSQYVQFRKTYSERGVERAINQHDCFWIHPVPRKIDNPIRKQISSYFNHYVAEQETIQQENPALKPLLEKVRGIEGWLDDQEAELLIKIIEEKTAQNRPLQIVEVGSFCGKATALMALSAKEKQSKVLISAIDTFCGKAGSKDTRIIQYPPTYHKFLDTIKELNLGNLVFAIRSEVKDVPWEKEIDLLIIDGLHDYASVAKDFYHFEKFLKIDAWTLFHDYADYFPGVTAFVDELLATKMYKRIASASSLVVLENLKNTRVRQLVPESRYEEKLMVSCIMPTYQRSVFLSQSIQQFLHQEYEHKELIIVDDSPDVIKSQMPSHNCVKYLHYDHKLTIGEKRNLACEMAIGEIILHWDDDDWYAPDWIQLQVTKLMEDSLDITGLNKPFFYNESLNQSWQYIYPAHEKPWVHGATLCYRKSFWKNNPFPEINIGEDNQFLWNSVTKNIKAHDALNSYLGRLHNNNTSPKTTSGKRWVKTSNDISKHIIKRCRMEKDNQI